MEWKGANALLLNEYFENKEKLFELKKKKEYLEGQNYEEKFINDIISNTFHIY